ncbi:hypothetical protein APHAL10511_002947 [Amanita phalloides]|nr:hypothetical protein APHAL10511_002947 [Amanita phalloides]
MFFFTHCVILVLFVSLSVAPRPPPDPVHVYNSGAIRIDPDYYGEQVAREFKNIETECKDWCKTGRFGHGRWNPETHPDEYDECVKKCVTQILNNVEAHLDDKRMEVWGNRQRAWEQHWERQKREREEHLGRERQAQDRLRREHEAARAAAAARIKKEHGPQIKEEHGPQIKEEEHEKKEHESQIKKEPKD